MESLSGTSRSFQRVILIPSSIPYRKVPMASAALKEAVKEKGGVKYTNPRTGKRSSSSTIGLRVNEDYDQTITKEEYERCRNSRSPISVLGECQ